MDSTKSEADQPSSRVACKDEENPTKSALEQKVDELELKCSTQAEKIARLEKLLQQEGGGTKDLDPATFTVAFTDAAFEKRERRASVVDGVDLGARDRPQPVEEGTGGQGGTASVAPADVEDDNQDAQGGAGALEQKQTEERDKRGQEEQQGEDDDGSSGRHQEQQSQSRLRSHRASVLMAGTNRKYAIHIPQTNREEQIKAAKLLYAKMRDLSASPDLTMEEVLAKVKASVSELGPFQPFWDTFLTKVGENFYSQYHDTSGGSNAKVTFAAILTLTDMATDFGLAVSQINSDDPGIQATGWRTLGIIVLSCFVQGVLAIANNDDFRDTLLSFFGVRGIIDAWRFVFKYPKKKGTRLSPLLILILARICEAIFESLLQIVNQAFSVVGDNGGGSGDGSGSISILQIATVAVSCISVGFSVATATIDVDSNSGLRKRFPKVCGMTPKDDPLRSIAFTVAQTAWVGTRALNASIGFASLIGTNAGLAGFSLSLGLVVFVLVLFLAQGGRLGWFQRLGASGTSFASVVMTIIFLIASYVSIFAVPGAIFKVPNLCTGQVFFLTLLLTTIATSTMVVLCNGHDSDVAEFFYGTLSLEAVSFIASVALTADGFRHTWFYSKNWAEEIEEEAWYNVHFAKDWKDPELLGDLHASRAHLLFGIPKQYHPPEEKVLADLEPSFRAWAAMDEPPSFLGRQIVLLALQLDGYASLHEHAKVAFEKLKAIRKQKG